MADAIRLHGFRELDRAFKQVGKETTAGLREEQRDVAEPVRVTSERWAQQRITRIGPPRAKSWARMRVGVTTKVVYVAPKQRSRRSTRPRFGDKLIRIMEDALESHAPEMVRNVERMLDRVADRAGF